MHVACLEVFYFSHYFGRGAIRALPEKIDLAAGILDEASYGIEPVEKLRSRAHDWAQLVGEERVWLTTSFGFGRHPARDHDRLRQKTENLKVTAQSL